MDCSWSGGGNGCAGGSGWENAGQDVTKKIDTNCRREFGSQGESAVMDCKIAVTVKTIEKLQGDSLDRAGAGVR